MNKDNKLLYSVPYQHFTNCIEGYFNVLKSKLNKKKGLGYEKLNKNVKEVLKDIPKKIYLNLFRGSYNRNKKYIPKISTCLRKPKNYK